MNVIKPADDRSDEILELGRLRVLRDAPRERIEAASEAIRRRRHDASASANHIANATRRSNRYYVVSDLALEHEGEPIRIDHLIFHRMLRRLVVVDSGRISESLNCDSHGNWTASRTGSFHSIPSPLVAVRRNEANLRRWLAARSLDGARSTVPVVLVGSRMRAERAVDHADDTTLLRIDSLGPWLEADITATSVMSMHKRFLDYMTDEQARAFMQAIASAHRPTRMDWPKWFGMETRILEREMSPKQADASDHPASEAQRIIPGIPNSPIGPHRTSRRFVPFDGGIAEISRYEDGTRSLKCDDRRMDSRIARACSTRSAQWDSASRCWFMDYATCRAVVLDLGGSDTRPGLTSHPDWPGGTIATSLGDVHVLDLGDGRCSIRTPANAVLDRGVERICSPVSDWDAIMGRWVVDGAHARSAVRRIAEI